MKYAQYLIFAFINKVPLQNLMKRFEKNVCLHNYISILGKKKEIILICIP